MKIVIAFVVALGIASSASAQMFDNGKNIGGIAQLQCSEIAQLETFIGKDNADLALSFFGAGFINGMIQGLTIDNKTPQKRAYNAAVWDAYRRYVLTGNLITAHIRGECSSSPTTKNIQSAIGTLINQILATGIAADAKR